MTFESLGLSADLLQTVMEEGYTEPTPVQAKAIPLVLAGRDVLAAAQTGTGKTAAFTLPILDRLRPHANTSFSPARHPVRALILVPTRELAMQVDESVRTYGRTVPLRSTVVYGGIPMDPQIKALRGGIEILVATPGRLLDLVGQRVANLGQVEILVLDEADRMLDMGFLPDIQKIIALLPPKRQNLMFSATFSDDIRRLSGTILRNPERSRWRRGTRRSRRSASSSTRSTAIARKQLLAHLIRKEDLRQVLVFTRTKLARHAARDLARPGRDRRRRDPQRPIAAGADAGPRGVQDRRDPGPRRDRRRGPRPRHRGPAPRRELRAAVEPAGLHPPDRPDRAGRCDGRRDQPRLHRRDGPAARRPAAAPQGDPVDRRGRLHPGSEHPSRGRCAAAATRRRGGGGGGRATTTPIASRVRRSAGVAGR